MDYQSHEHKIIKRFTCPNCHEEKVVWEDRNEPRRWGGYHTYESRCKCDLENYRISQRIADARVRRINTNKEID